MVHGFHIIGYFNNAIQSERRINSLVNFRVTREGLTGDLIIYTKRLICIHLTGFRFDYIILAVRYTGKLTSQALHIDSV